VQEALTEISRHISAAAAKESADTMSTDAPTGRTAVVDQIEFHINQFRCVEKE